MAIKNMSDKEIAKIRNQAENYYRNGDFYCSEAVVKSVLDSLEMPYDSRIVAAASGFPVGIGGAECLCGALSGGVMAIGYLYGRTEAAGAEVHKAMQLSNDLHQRFVKRNRITCCKALTKGMVKGSEVHMTQCIRFTGEVTEDVLKIIREINVSDL